MKKVKGFKNKIAEAGKSGKSKLDTIRAKEWAEPTGAVLKAAANAASLIPPPAGGVIKGALSMGGSILNPDPTLGDLRRATAKVKEEVRSSLKDVAEEMSELGDDLSTVHDGVENLLEIITDETFYRGIEGVEEKSWKLCFLVFQVVPIESSIESPNQYFAVRFRGRVHIT